MFPLALLVAASVIPTTHAHRPGQADQRPVSLERQLWGTWRGAACAGELILKANGTFARRHYGPAGHSLSGTWAVRWDALPPTLVLTCRDADWPGDIGTAEEVKLVRLDGEALAYHRAGSDQPTRYARVRPKK